MRRMITLLFLSSFLFSGHAWASNPKSTQHKYGFHASPPMKIFSSGELRFLKQFKGWFSQQHLRNPTMDHGLRTAAWYIAQQLAKRRLRTLPHSLVNSAMWMGGRSDKKLQIFARAFTRPALLWKQLYHTLARSLAGKRSNYFGFAIVGKKVKFCVLLLVRRGASLAFIPRWSIVGQTLWLRGELLQKFKKPSFILGWANGRVVKLKTRMLPRGHFIASWYITTPAPIKLQVMVQDDEGPWISAECKIPVYPKRSDMYQKVKRLWAKHLQRIQHQPRPKTTRWLSMRKKKWEPKKAERELLKLVNQMRIKNQLPPFKRHATLDAMARSHANDMVKEHFFAHTSPQRGSFRERFRKLYWRVNKARENIVSAKTPKQAFRLLFQSPIHRVNLLLKKAKLIGIGAAKDTKGELYFTQVFVELKPRVIK